MPQATLKEQQTLVSALLHVLQGTGERVQLFETHISWVLVAGAYAYKIKKAVHFDFLDFSTLALRRHYCNEELRLNRRLAPAMYLGVVAIAGSAHQPRLEAPGGPSIEYAVKMRAFPQEALWDRRLEQGSLTANDIADLAQQLVRFHKNAQQAPAESDWGTPETVRRVADDNFALLAALSGSASRAAAVEALRAWQDRQYRRLHRTFAERKAGGWVRECHGDLHSGNIFTADGKVQVFDCIEFNDSLRWTDVMHDLAFIRMDLQLHHCAPLAARLVNDYLRGSGDYEGVALLRFYHVECALVRAKIELARARQLDPAAGLAHERRADALIAAARDASKPGRTCIIMLHGFAGSGKSTVAQHLVELIGALQLRSDVERKRMRGFAPVSLTKAPSDTELYDQEVTDAVYARLGALAAVVVRAGMPVVIDACCLKHQQRRLFETLASELGVAMFLIDVRASEATLRARIRERLQQGSDPSDADESVLERQLRAHDPLTASERACALSIDSEASFQPDLVKTFLGFQ